MFRHIPTLLAAALLLLPATAPAQTRPSASAPAPGKPAPPVQLPPNMRVPALPPEKPLPFAAEIAAFEKRDAIVMPTRDGVLFLGSSSIRMWTDLPRDFAGHNVINRGFGGSTIPDSVRYADRIAIPYSPRTIVFYAGDNDLAAGHTPEEVTADFQALVAKVHARLPRTRILFLSIKPSLSRWQLMDSIRTTNALIQAYTATDPRLGYIDIVPAMLGPDGKPRPELFREDGLHMTRAGYDIWRAAVGKALNWKLPPKPPAKASGKPAVSGPVRSSKAGR
jgi:lysophospholipase L1-like esterase